MSQVTGDFTKRICERFLEKLRDDGEIPPSLIDEIERLMDNKELASSAAIFRAYEDWEANHAED